MVKLIQTRFIVEGLKFTKGRLQEDNFWFVDNEILLKEIDNKLSAFVVSEVDDSFVANEEDYKRIGDDKKKRKQADDNWKVLEEDAKQKIQSFVRLFPILTNKTPIAIYSGSRQITSVDHICKPPFSVDGSIAFTSGLSLNEDFLRKTKGLYNDIKELHKNFLFLDAASKYYYQARNPIIDKLEFGKFDSRQFVDGMITLECLFNDGSTDIKHKLSLRNASLLAFIGYNRKKVFEDTKILYEKRNEIVHGLTPKPSKRPTLEDTYRLLEYAGKSLVCSYILYGDRPTTNKQDLMRELDDTLLVYSKQKRMRKEIALGVSRFPTRMLKPSPFIKAWNRKKHPA